MSDEDLLDSFEVAELACMRVERVRVFARKPGFPVPATSPGRLRRWRRVDVEAWLDAREERLRRQYVGVRVSR